MAIQQNGFLGLCFISLVAKYAMLFSLNISYLPLNFLFPKGVVIARAVEIDNIAFARIFKNWSIRTEGFFLNSGKLQITKRSRCVGNFRNYAFSRPCSRATQYHQCPCQKND